MTVLTMNRKELEARVGKITPEIENKITMMGTPVENVSENEVAVEVFPNRPDLLSLQGFARSFLQYIGKTNPAQFVVNKPEKDYAVTIDKSVKQVRPQTVCAIVKNLKLNDEKIKEIVDIQEKLHLTIGRKRKKLAIGVYPLEHIKLPITFMAKKPEDIKFVPLESPGLKEMNGRQILRNHPTGRDYAFLLEDAEVFPVFVDASNKILSMPPIINSHETGKITEKTTEVFIECSGHNLPYLKKALNIIVAAMIDMGGKVYAMNIYEGWTGKTITPDLEPEQMEFSIENINKVLGLQLTEKEIIKNLQKMGVGYKNEKGKSIALVPAYRADVLHWVDLAEEVAIGYGYDNFKPEIPAISTIGEEDFSAVKKRTVCSILTGLGLLECSSFHLTTKDDIKKMNYEFRDFIEVLDSKTEYQVLRNDLTSNLLKIFSENSDSQYPQKIFEIGRVFELDKESKTETGIKETDKLAIAICQETVSFTDLKQILDYLFKMLEKPYEIKEAEVVGYISGRCGHILVDGKVIGVLGEIAPRVLKNWKIKMPVVSCEIEI